MAMVGLIQIWGKYDNFFQVYSNLIIKNPVTLEFVGLKPDASYSESNLEPAIIGKMQMYVNY